MLSKPINNLAIVQARMSSKRLPGKVLKKICGIPMILFQLRRLQESKYVDEIILATSTNSEDDILVSTVQSEDFKVFRGSLNNVLERFYECSKVFKAKNIIRITGDCPFTDPKLVDELITNFSLNNYEYMTNCYDEDNLSVPDGFDLEIFLAKSLEYANNSAQLSSEKEHVTPWFRSKESNLRWIHFCHKPSRSFYRVTVDDELDLRVVRAIADFLYPKDTFFGIDKVIKYLDENADIANINSSAIRNSGYLKSISEES